MIALWIHLGKGALVVSIARTKATEMEPDRRSQNCVSQYSLTSAFTYDIISSTVLLRSVSVVVMSDVLRLCQNIGFGSSHHSPAWQSNLLSPPPPHYLSISFSLLFVCVCQRYTYATV